MEEESVSQDQTEDILKEDDEKTAETVEEAEEQESKEETEASDTSSEESQKEPEKKGFFGKKKKDKKDEKIEELTDMVKRQMAEFDNYRKRTEKEKSSMYEIGAREVIEKILPIVDNFERGLAAVPEEEKETPFVDGMNKIYRQLLSVFEGMGVKTIESVGQEFNPDYHNAVMHVEDEEAGENIVVEEFQKGYTYKDTVIRHSMVKVAN
ncbi:MAG TPA: nucleotide exchange factor GrpE [Candidatus Blautia pullistercoris]|uniref:Protein GrpE n=1 Tax=Candidatus Blautia pullistercoris TaxID=2838499 RepID=A0A9D2APE0_9FIRM|nr:nucleotide exchange factor GrpE [Candidatus Blautia pullistercoris]